MQRDACNHHACTRVCDTYANTCTHVRGVYGTLNSRVPRIVGTGVVSFKSVGLPVLVFIQQAEQCTGLSVPVPHCCLQDHQQPVATVLSVALSLSDD